MTAPATTTHEITVRIRATEGEGAPFTDADLRLAVAATLHEVFPADDGMPVVPDVDLILAPLHEPLIAEGGRRCDYAWNDGSLCNLLPEEHETVVESPADEVLRAIVAHLDGLSGDDVVELYGDEFATLIFQAREVA